MKRLIKVLKGTLVGMASILPGVSGAVIATTLNIYQELVFALNKVTKEPFKAILSIFEYLIGIVFGVLVGFIIMWLLFEMIPIPITFLFIGFILGTLPSLIKKVDLKKTKWHHLLISALTIVVMILLMLVKDKSNSTSIEDIPFYIYLFIGFLIALSMIVPGLSGAALLMAIGYFTPLLDLGGTVITHFLEFNIKELFSYAPDFLFIMIGGALSLIIMGRVMGYILKNYEKHFYFAIFGLILIIPLNIVAELGNDGYLDAPWYHYFIGSMLLILGFIVVYIMTKKEQEIKGEINNVS